MKRFIQFLLAFLISCTPALAQQTTLDTDSFNGTNGNTLSTYNAKWSAGASCCNEAIIAGSPGAGAAGGSFEKNAGQTWTNDQWAELKVDGTTVASDGWEVCVRVIGDAGTAGSAYCGGKDAGSLGNDVRIIKWVANAPSSLAVDAVPLAVNDVLNLQVVGNPAQLILKKNGSTLLTITDSSSPLTSGNTGLYLDHVNSTDRLAGTWKAGSVGGGGGPSSVTSKRNKLTKLGLIGLLDFRRADLIGQLLSWVFFNV